MKSKSMISSILIIILVICAIFIFLNYRQRPYKVITPEDNSVVALYEEVPKGFPSELILEVGLPQSSSVVTLPNNQKQMTVIYLSNKKLEELMPIYEKNFIAKGWTIKNKTQDKAGTFLVAKNDQTLILTISNLNEKELMLTFQYEK